YSGRDVNHSATGKVDCTCCTKVEEEAVFSPYPVGKGIIDDQTPQRDEEAVSFKRNTLGKRARDQSRSDDGKFCLEHREDEFRNPCAEDRFVDTVQQAVVGIPTEPSAQYVSAEGHAIAADDPKHRHATHSCEAVQHGAEHVFGANATAIEHGKSRKHTEDKCRGR